VNGREITGCSIVEEAMFRLMIKTSLFCVLVGCSNKKSDTPQQPHSEQPQSGQQDKPWPGPPTQPFNKGPGFGQNQPPPDLSKVEFTLTAETFGKELETKGEAIRQKYTGKAIELTGIVWFCESESDNREIDFYPSVPDDRPPSSYISVALQANEWEKEQGLRALAKGQLVTVRGIGDFSSAHLKNGKIMKVGPSPAKPVSLSELGRALKDENDKMEYDGKCVLVRARVVKPAPKDTIYCWVVTDPDRADGPEFLIAHSPIRVDLVKKQLLALKPGDVVLLIGHAEGYSSVLAIWDTRLLKEPPTGVTVSPKKPQKSP